MHWAEAARRVVSGAGIQRFGSRIQQAFEEAVRLGVQRRLFVKCDNFPAISKLWLMTVRWFGAPGTQNRLISDSGRLSAHVPLHIEEAIAAWPSATEPHIIAKMQIVAGGFITFFTYNSAGPVNNAEVFRNSRSRHASAGRPVGARYQQRTSTQLLGCSRISGDFDS